MYLVSERLMKEIRVEALVESRIGSRDAGV